MLLAFLITLAAPPATDLELDPVTDGAVIGIGLGLSAATQLLIASDVLPATVPRAPERLPSIDRRYVGGAGGSPITGRLMSDGGLLLAGGIAVAGIGVTWHERSGAEAFEDVVLLAQSALINTAASNVVKLAARRPRPQAYDHFDAHAPTDLGLSFYSGHTSLAAGLWATSSYLAFERRHRLRWVTFAIGGLVTTTVAVGRVVEREHFPTDVIAGALVGAGIGLLVPHMHQADVRLSVSPDAIGIQGRF